MIQDIGKKDFFVLDHFKVARYLLVNETLFDGVAQQTLFGWTEVADLEGVLFVELWKDVHFLEFWLRVFVVIQLLA